MIPRPLQRPSDIERRPIDFGIEPAPVKPAKPEATIIKGAISLDSDQVLQDPSTESAATTPAEIQDDPADDWGDGIF